MSDRCDLHHQIENENETITDSNNKYGKNESEVVNAL